MIKVGLTGGIGSGKTTVAKLFEKKGIPVYYADTKAKHLMTYDKLLKFQIIKAFGKDVYHSNGRLNRKALASIIFNDKSKLTLINNLVHPAIAADGKAWYQAQNTMYAIKEAALMIESGSHQDLDVLVVVTADIKERIRRVQKRDHVSMKTVEERINNQLSDAERLAHADYIIDNNDFGKIEEQVDALHEELVRI
ncbi:MAG: dephospho-CoA kinase [Saprospiraceae bacterium]|jgi:dephospho-CoA kinase